MRVLNHTFSWNQLKLHKVDAGLSGAHIGRTDFPEANQITSHANCTLEHLKTLMKNPEPDHICVVGDHEMNCCHAQALLVSSCKYLTSRYSGSGVSTINFWNVNKVFHDFQPSLFLWLQLLLLQPKSIMKYGRNCNFDLSAKLMFTYQSPSPYLLDYQLVDLCALFSVQ